MKTLSALVICIFLSPVLDSAEAKTPKRYKKKKGNIHTLGTSIEERESQSILGITPEFAYQSKVDKKNIKAFKKKKYKFYLAE